MLEYRVLREMFGFKKEELAEVWRKLQRGAAALVLDSAVNVVTVFEQGR